MDIHDQSTNAPLRHWTDTYSEEMPQVSYGKACALPQLEIALIQNFISIDIFIVLTIRKLFCNY